jgi:hypothetical protein
MVSKNLKIIIITSFVILCIILWMVLRFKVIEKFKPIIEKFNYVDLNGKERAFATTLRSQDPEVEKVAQTYKTIKLTASPKVPLPQNFDGRIVWKDYLTSPGDQGS